MQYALIPLIICAFSWWVPSFYADSGSYRIFSAILHPTFEHLDRNLDLNKK